MRNEYLRHVLVSVAAQCRHTRELFHRLRAYGITLKRRGNTVSVLPPGGRRAVRLRTLGLEWTDIEQLMALRREREQLAEQQWWVYVRYVRSWWHEAHREACGHPHGVLDSLLLLVLSKITLKPLHNMTVVSVSAAGLVLCSILCIWVNSVRLKKYYSL